MADLEGIVLYKILEDPSKGLEHWAKLKPAFFSAEHSKIYSTLANFYTDRGRLPSFEDLEILIRNKNTLNTIIALKQLQVEDDVDLNLVCDAILDIYTQDEALKELNNFVDDITFLSCDDIKQELTNIALRLEDKTLSSDEVYRATEMHMFDEEEFKRRVFLGISNSFDAHTGGAALSELIMIGGYRGSGKSVVSSNIQVSQYENGKVCPYFSIEMPANQVLRRNMAIMAQINASRIKKHQSTSDELNKLAEVRASMFSDADDLLFDWKDGKYQTFSDFDNDLIHKKEEGETPMIIIKDRNLNLTQIDIHLTKLKERYGERCDTCVVDYINQLAVEDMYDWKVQIELSKQLKNLADKHEVVMITPYQIDNKGEARFSKGILDAADVAMTLDKGEDYITFNTSKIRDDGDITFSSLMNWECLRISPEEKQFDDGNEEIPVAKAGEDEEKEKDLPW